MNGLVKVALARPYTFIVMAIMIMIMGPAAAIRTPTDIFPNIGVPVIGVAFTYTGLSPDEMAGRMVTGYERFIATTVNDIEHIESTSLSGISTVKIFFQPNADIRTATAQVTSTSQTALRQMPPNANPPLIINYNASTVPILQLATSSPTMSEQQVLDTSQNFMRPALSNVPGASIPFSYGGRVRQIVIDLDPAALQSRKLSAQDVMTAIAAQNQIVPAGTVKIGPLQYAVKLNNSVGTIDELNRIPIRTVDGATIYISDVGHVRDGSAPQQSIVHVDGSRAVLTSILKAGKASTVDVVDEVKARLPKLQETLPADFKISLLSDQSQFVKAAVDSVIHEGVIAAALTSVMILLFLGSWRSTVIIAVSIPLSIMCALIALSVTGQTLNIMTLGGLALAVGILVDDATVTIENINWHLEKGKPVKVAILDGAQQIVTPAFVSLLCICIAFLPMFALPGVAGFLFSPMALAVVFAMIASFLLSRTLVPTMAMYLLKPHQPGGHAAPTRNPLVRFQRGFEARFNAFREGYHGLLGMVMDHRRTFVAGFLGVVALSMCLAPFLGSNFFPSVDSGQITVHVRPRVGTRIENATAEFGRVQQAIRNVIPASEISSIVDNIGLPTSPLNMLYNTSGLIGYQDGDIYVTLNKHHGRTADYVRVLRERLPREFPGATFSFPPADIITQILNFGAPAPIDLQIAGPNQTANRAYAAKLLTKMRMIPGIADARLHQSNSNPQLNIDVDRSRMAQLGLTERDVTNSVVTSLAGSSQTAPTFWLNPANGVTYPIVAQTPEYKLDSIASLENLPVTPNGGGDDAHMLGGLGNIKRVQSNAVVTHYGIQPTIDLYATTQGRDLGSVAADIRKLIKEEAGGVPKGSTVTLRGQAVTMDTAFNGLFIGLAGSVLLIYLLIVVNFQSWTDPFVIITALPAALAGIVWTLFVTNTTLSVPALTGAIMCMGVATANSILVVSFARERLAEHGDAMKAALEAGFTRFRPVLMTALAMIIGMAPMAIGMGEGGEQNAPLGRAVIGGLICATFATLMFVPVVFSLVHGRRKAASDTRPAPIPPYAGEAHV